MRKEEWQERYLTDEELTRDRNTEILKSSRNYSLNPMSLESARKKSGAKKRKLRLIVAALTVAAVIIFSSVCFHAFFKMDNLIVKNCTRYTDAQVLKGAGLLYGENIYKKGKRELRENIDKHLPFIEYAEIKRVWPSTIVISVTETVDVAFLEFSGSYYILSERMRVLEKTADIERIEAEKLLRIYPGEIKKCVVGEYLALADRDNYYTAIEIMENMSRAKIRKECAQLDLRNKFNIVFVYRSRFQVRLGDGYDTDIKIDFMKAIAEKLYDSETGIIDVSDSNLREGVVIRDT